ncbi:MAG: NAD(P)-binding domain-containing protein [Ignavibacteriae bacterium]|nr:NAD(P)-binding domain-containing protein [Ignavibacteriota bacterium]
MKITVLGTGVVGQTISEKLIELGHEIFIGTREVNNTLSKTNKDNFGRPPFSEWHKNNNSAKLETYSNAAKSGELIVNATSGTGTLDALILCGKENLANKILVDISNPLDFSKGMPPTLTICNSDSLGEQIQKEFPKTKVVKTLNTLTAHLMINPSIISGDHNLFISGNDNSAKEEVEQLLISFGWKKVNIIDLGDISTARGTEMLLPIWIRLWGALGTPEFNFHIVKK